MDKDTLEYLKSLGISVARGVPQLATGFVDLAALPFTLSGLIKPEQAVGSTDYMTAKGYLPPKQEGLLNETTELLSGVLNPAGAVKGGLLGIGALGTMAAKGAKYSPEQMTVFSTQKKERDLLRTQESEALRQQEKALANKRIEQVGTVGTSKFFTPEEIESQKYFYQSGDSAGAQAEGKLNAVNAIERYLVEKNIPIEKVTFSKDDNSKSIYAKIDGKTVRISDHYLPETPQRLHNREQGLTGKWEHEVIVGDWRKDLDDYIKEITNF